MITVALWLLPDFNSDPQKGGGRTGYDPKRVKSLETQMYEKLTDMFRAGKGTSKHEGKLDGSMRVKIYSNVTFKTYKQHGGQFVQYIKDRHPDVSNLKQARKYVPEYLAYYEDRTDSASSVMTARSALNKLCNIQVGDREFYDAQPRHRADFKRSRRDDIPNKQHFSETNNRELVDFCKGTGCRRNVLEKLQGRDYVTRGQIKEELKRYESMAGVPMLSKEMRHVKALEDALRNFPDKEHFVHHRNDKGGKERYAPIIGENTDKIIAKMKNTATNERVWSSVPVHADVHSYRANYATDIYKEYARPIAQIPYDRINVGSGHKYQSGVYVCRGDAKGVRLDKLAMDKASKALGHNRRDVIARHYIRNL